MCPERNLSTPIGVRIHVHTRTSIRVFESWGTRQGADMALNGILMGFIDVFSLRMWVCLSVGVWGRFRGVLSDVGRGLCPHG